MRRGGDLARSCKQLKSSLLASWFIMALSLNTFRLYVFSSSSLLVECILKEWIDHSLLTAFPLWKYAESLFLLLLFLYVGSGANFLIGVGTPFSGTRTHIDVLCLLLRWLLDGSEQRGKKQKNRFENRRRKTKSHLVLTVTLVVHRTVVM